MKRAYSYLRVSSRAQAADDRDGYPRQRDAIAKFAAENKLEIVGEFAEKVSGRVESMDRPMFREMLDCIQNRRDHCSELVDIIIVERQDRLARDLLVGELLLETCRNQKLIVYSTDQGPVDIATDDTDPTRILIRQIMSALSQWDRSTLVRKLAAGRERARSKRTHAAGGDPYGHTSAEKFIIDQVLKARAAGSTVRQIAAYLDDEGLRNRHNRPISFQAVGVICKKHKETNVGSKNNSAA